ncbi:Cell division cycle 7-related protein kinase [Chionoecetes opilio]|uniref:non-specific serine/threonine protein kinase n=1 Tax=Chionoecetes opilio TaxID=41210 RepID=A0A8J4YA90_CHIOP|nr:Cell division cycle 7-related protein kinase [Chionoecetes opilio]
MRDYLVNLLHALRRVHSFKVIHRDVKPANFLYNRRHRRYSLVDFGLAQEISDRGRSSGPASQGRGLKASPPITDTPLSTSSTKTVKRKLSVYSAEDGDELGKQPWGKRQCAGILSSSTSRLNTALRRSPRKKCLSHTSPRKENFEIPSQDFPVTPKKAAACDSKGSPSKHTRSSAEACCRLDTLGSGAQRSLTGALQLRLEVANGLRRSPRKIASSANRKILTPLEGLAKHLHDASSLHSYSAKPTAKEESNVLGRHGIHLPSHASPRVSGLSFNPDVNGVVSKSSKNRTLIEVQSGSGSVLRAVSCHCYGSAKVCSVCLTRSNQVAPRAGTPGFRAPEVLMRHPHQDTGVDMWSVGVVLLSLLSGRYPFFRAVDDLSNLAEITTLLGTAAVRRAAAKMGKLFKCSEEHHPVDLMKVCEFLHSNTVTLPQGELCPGCRQRGLCVCLSPLVSDSPRMPNRKKTHSQKSSIIKNDTTMLTPVQKDIAVDAGTSLACTPDTPESRSVSVNGDLPWGMTSSSSSSASSSTPQTYPVEAYHLLMRLLDPSPDTRITAAEALGHPFLNPEERKIIFAESLEVLVMALEALHEEAKPLGLEVSWLKTKVQPSCDILDRWSCPGGVEKEAYIMNATDSAKCLDVVMEKFGNAVIISGTPGNYQFSGPVVTVLHILADHIGL